MPVRTLIAMILALLISLTACRRDVPDDSSVPDSSSASEETNELLQQAEGEEPVELLTERNLHSELIEAAQNGEREEVVALLEAGAEVSEKTRDGSSPLMLAASNGHTSTVEALLEADADVNARDNDQHQTAPGKWKSRGHTSGITP